MVTTQGRFKEAVDSISYLTGSYISYELYTVHWVSFIHWASLEVFAQFVFPLLKHGFFHHASPGWWPWPHPLSSKVIMVMNTGNCPKVPEMEPIQMQDSSFYAPSIKRREMVQPMPTIRCFYRQPRQPPCARHVMTLPTHPPYPILLLVQNLSSKRIAPTDKMQPKLHEEYIPHMWFKG